MQTGDLLWLAIAGALIVLYGLYVFLRPEACQCRRLGRQLTTLVLVVRDQEEIIEGVMRELANLLRQRANAVELIVVDRFSTDQTLSILRRIQRFRGDFILLGGVEVDPADIPLGVAGVYGRGRRLCCLELDRPITAEVAVKTIAGLLDGEPEVDEELAKVYYLMRSAGSGGV